MVHHVHVQYICIIMLTVAQVSVLCYMVAAVCKNLLQTAAEVWKSVGRHCTHLYTYNY